MRRKEQTYTHEVRETWLFPLVESKATAGKPYWNARHDVTGSGRNFLALAY